MEHKKNHKKFSLTFKKEVAIKANKSLKKKKQMFGILKNENEKKKTASQIEYKALTVESHIWK